MKPTRLVNPVDLESEGLLVACIFQRPELIRELEDLSASDFSSIDLRAIYTSMVDMEEDGIPIDPVSLFTFMRSNDNLSLFGGEDGLKHSLSDVACTNIIPTYAPTALRLIKEQRLRYELWVKGAELYQSMAEPATDVAEAVQTLKELANKVCEKYQYPTKVSEKLRSWIMGSSGTFYTTDIYGEMGVKDPQTKKAIIQALNRFKEQGLIERAGLKRGCYRLVETKMDIMDFRGDTPPPMDIQWPFEIEEFVKILPKTIVLVAGAPDAGKSAFLLNVIKMNQQRHRTWYFNSEMGPTELKSRLLLFDDMQLDDWTFTPVARAQNFSDVIQPDDLNIIDYLEVSDQMWMVGEELNMIHRKLRNGCAIVALQKDDFSVLGRGKSFSLEKPRLYLTIDKPGILRIVKAKNWKIPARNPNDMAIEFKLVQGSKLIPQGNWYKDRSAWERQMDLGKKKKKGEGVPR